MKKPRSDSISWLTCLLCLVLATSGQVNRALVGNATYCSLLPSEEANGWARPSKAGIRCNFGKAIVLRAGTSTSTKFRAFASILSTKFHQLFRFQAKVPPSMWPYLTTTNFERCGLILIQNLIHSFYFHFCVSPKTCRRLTLL